MRDFEERTAFVTGGASGIGFALARAFGAAGMQVMLADIEEAALAAAVDDLRARQIRADGLICDVSRGEAVERAAARTFETFGNVHVVCNNAGVGVGGLIGEASHNAWDWVLGVNLLGVIHGLQVFVPHLKRHGEGGHIVNTASMSGMVSFAGLGPYSASKYAVVSISETLSQELEPFGVGVSVLCPGWVRTAIAESSRNRPAHLEDDAGAPVPDVIAERAQEMRQLIAAGLDPDVVAARVIEAVREGELYIFTHPDMQPLLEQRFDAIRAAYERAANSPALNHR